MWTAPLQFGHGFEAVETEVVPAPTPETMMELQFGHGFEAVETAIRAAIHTDQAWLQFGHGFEAVETDAAADALQAATAASIRPRLRSRGNRQEGPVVVVNELLLQFGHGFEAVETSL